MARRRTRGRTNTVETTARVTRVTPELATQWLERDVDVRRNAGGDEAKKRGIRDRQVEYLAGVMSRGEWRLNGETIVVANDGHVLQGNHRLWAVIASGVTIESWTIEGAEEGSYVTYDTGWNRDAAQALAMGNEQYAKNLAAMARLQWNVDQTGGPIRSGLAVRASNAELVAVVAANPDLRLGAAFAERGRAHGRPLLPKSVIGFLHFAISRKHDVETVERFLAQVLEGFELTEGSPVFRLRKRLIDNATAPTALRSPPLMALTIIAWNAQLQRKRPRYIAWREDQPWPEIV